MSRTVPSTNVLLVDLDDTLVDRRGAFIMWLADLARHHRLTDAEVTVAADLDLAHRERGAFFVALHERVPELPPPDVMWADYRKQMPQLVQLYPGVQEALGALHDDGWRICVVTNGKADNQTGKIARTGLGELVDASCVSETVGHRKPSPAFFAAALAAVTTTSSGQRWIVGDSPADDIEGGRAAGLLTSWVSHDRVWPDELPRPNAIHRTTVEALTAIRR